MKIDPNRSITPVTRCKFCHLYTRTKKIGQFSMNYKSRKDHKFKLKGGKLECGCVPPKSVVEKLMYID